MPTRLIRDSAKTSPTLALLSAEAERLFWRLTTEADDYGRFDGDPRVILAGCFPLLIEKLSSDQIAQWCGELEDVGTIIFYVVDTRRYGYFPKWFKYQRMYERKNGSKFPEPPDTSGRIPEHPGDSGRIPENPALFEGKESKVKGKESREEEKPTHHRLVDDEFLIEQEQSPVYTGINIRREFEKFKKWMKENNRTTTKAAFINWLNRIDPKPTSSKQPGKYAGVTKH